MRKGIYTVIFPDVPEAVGEDKRFFKALIMVKKVQKPHTNIPIEKVVIKVVAYVLADMSEDNEITKSATIKKKFLLQEIQLLRVKKQT